MAIPGWIGDLVPFISGACGVGLAWGIIKQKVDTNSESIKEMREVLKCQVGEERCNHIREECKEAMKETLRDIKEQIEKNRDTVTRQFQEIARFMGKHNGD